MDFAQQVGRWWEEWAGRQEGPNDIYQKGDRRGVSPQTMLTHLRGEPQTRRFFPELLVAQLTQSSGTRSFRHAVSVENCLLDSPEHHPPAKSRRP
jgi:hypothetical protein